MKETGILFTPDNHRLIISGEKTQTRRVITRIHSPHDENRPKHCPYGRVSDKLYIKEGTWVWCDAALDGTTKTGRPKVRYVPVGNHVIYCLGNKKPTERIDNNPRHCWHHRTALFMPKKDARTWMELTDVRVERLQDISEEDSIAEGVYPQIVTEQDIQDTINGTSEPHIKELARILGPGQFTAKFKYQELWDSINKAKHPWAQNPFVWVLEFRKI